MNQEIRVEPSGGQSGGPLFEIPQAPPQTLPSELLSQLPCDGISLGTSVDLCIYCRKDDFEDASKDDKPMPRTLVYCSSCAHACTHVEVRPGLA